MKFIRYLAVQLFAYGLDMGGFLLMTYFFGIDVIVANIFGKIVAGLFAFFVHRNFTFGVAEETNRGRQAIKYFTLLALNVPLSSAALSLMLLVLNLPLLATALNLVLLNVPLPVLAKFIADVICVFITFWLSKKYVFTAPRTSSVDAIVEGSSHS
jgi:putative flippase GtrA